MFFVGILVAFSASFNAYREGAARAFAVAAMVVGGLAILLFLLGPFFVALGV